MSTSDFCFCTSLPGECGLDAPAVEAGLESLRRRWNQNGLTADLMACCDTEVIVVRYRLRAGSRADPSGVHAAFRDDLDQALGGLVLPLPAAWDLAAMAEARSLAAAVAPARTYAADPGYRWAD